MKKDHQAYWAVRKSEVLKASFPLTYVECRKENHDETEL